MKIVDNLLDSSLEISRGNSESPRLACEAGFAVVLYKNVFPVSDSNKIKMSVFPSPSTFAAMYRDKHQQVRSGMAHDELVRWESHMRSLLESQARLFHQHLWQHLQRVNPHTESRGHRGYDLNDALSRRAQKLFT